jgi:hypothetical protein
LCNGRHHPNEAAQDFVRKEAALLARRKDAAEAETARRYAAGSTQASAAGSCVMGDIADMMLDGTLRTCCGTFLGEDTDYPIYCAECAEDFEQDGDDA